MKQTYDYLLIWGRQGERETWERGITREELECLKKVKMITPIILAVIKNNKRHESDVQMGMEPRGVDVAKR